MTKFPECTSQDKQHTWGKWELFEKNHTRGLWIHTITTQKRQCEVCGLTQFLNEKSEEVQE